MTDSAKHVAEQYYATWMDHNFDAFRALLADDATFDGPMGNAKDADECVEGIRHMADIMSGIDTTKMWVDGDDVITWYVGNYKGGQTVNTVNWMHIADGKIETIRATFDPRPILG